MSIRMASEVGVLGWIQAALLRGYGLRAGFRVLLHLGPLGVALVTAIAALVIAELLGLPYRFGSAVAPMVELAAQVVALVGALGVAHLLSAWILDARWSWPWRPGTARGAGLALDGRAAAEAGLGFTFGAGLLGLVALAGAAPGWTPEGPPPPPVISWGYVLVLVPAAMWEELMFRGYLFWWSGASIARMVAWALARWGSRAAGVGASAGFAAPILGLAGLFGLLHAGNPTADAVSTVNTALAGIWFGVLVVRSHSLWPAFFAHFGWNLATVLLGLPLSGLSEANGHTLPRLLTLAPTGPVWWTGGDYGPEGGLAGTLGLVLGIGLTFWFPRRPTGRGIEALEGPGDDIERMKLRQTSSDT